MVGSLGIALKLGASAPPTEVNMIRRRQRSLRWAAMLVVTFAASCDSGTETDRSGSVGSPASDAGLEPDSGSAAGGASAGDGQNAGGTTSNDPVTDVGSGTSAGSGGAQGGAGRPATRERPYAHVVAVSVSGTAGDYTFSVSVRSADIDCQQYADWWEVLSATGSLIYRRILQHSHTDDNGTSDADAPGNTFTREGGPVDIAEDEEVLVRAHMSNEGYYGTVMRGSVAAGFTPAEEVSGDFASDMETEPPQPEECLF